MKNITIALASLFFSFLCSESAMACWCRREVLDTEEKFKAAIAKEFRNSFIVFSGEAIERNRSGLKFRVEKVWKGDATDEIIFGSKIYVERGSSGEEVFIDSCALLFEVGKKYLVYTDRDGKDLYVSKCSRTQLLDDAERDIKELDILKARRRIQLTLKAIDTNRFHLMAKSNNSFNRSGISLSLIENLSHDVVDSRPVNSGVRFLLNDSVLRHESIVSRPERHRSS